MKHRVLFNVSLVLMMVVFCVPMFAQPSTKSVETILIDDFDDENNQDYQYNGEKVSWAWNVNASRFIAEGYPKKAFVPGIPNSLRPFRNADSPEAKVLGVKVAFDRKGDNWFEIYPTKAGDNGEDAKYEIPLTGNVSQIDFWVWGANYTYSLDILVRDADGRVNVIPCGSLAFNGWKNVIVKIPTTLRQVSRLRSGPKCAAFVGFRVKSDPSEYVDDFAIYFDNFKYTTYVLSNIYDGFDLRDIDFDNVEGSSSTSSAGQEDFR